MTSHAIVHFLPVRPVFLRANQYGTYVGSMSNHDKVYQNMIDVLLGGGVIATNGYEGMKTVEIIEKIYAAAEQQWRQDHRLPETRVVRWAAA